MQNGKGSKRRPMFITEDEWERRWRLIFGKKEDKEEKSKDDKRKVA